MAMPWRFVPTRFLEDECYLGLPLAERGMLLSLYHCCDKYGRGPAGPMALAKRLGLFDGTDVGAVLGKLGALGLVQVYEVDGVAAWELPRFDEDAPPNLIRRRKRGSDYPAPPTVNDGQRPSMAVNDGQRPSMAVNDGQRDGCDGQRPSMAVNDRHFPPNDRHFPPNDRQCPSMPVIPSRARDRRQETGDKDRSNLNREIPEAPQPQLDLSPPAPRPTDAFDPREDHVRWQRARLSELVHDDLDRINSGLQRFLELNPCPEPGVEVKVREDGCIRAVADAAVGDFNINGDRGARYAAWKHALSEHEERVHGPYWRRVLNDWSARTE